MRIAIYIAAFLLLFCVLPCFVITILLFRRKTIRDFDVRDKANMKGYAPFLDGILADMAYMRSLAPKELHITAPDGTRLAAEWYDAHGARTAILAHGFCSTPLNNFSTLGRELIGRGFNVLMIWQRGHGKSGGKYTTLGIKEHEDLLLWIDEAERLAPKTGIILYGISMGGATVAYASDRIASPNVKALCIDCCYCSPYDQMCRGKGLLSVLWTPIMPLIMLFSRLMLGVNIRKRTTDSLKDTRIPAVFLIGLDDETVTPKSFRANFVSCGSEKELIEVRSAPHALAFVAADEAARLRFFDFIDKSFREEVSL